MYQKPFGLELNAVVIGKYSHETGLLTVSYLGMQGTGRTFTEAKLDAQTKIQLMVLNTLMDSKTTSPAQQIGVKDAAHGKSGIFTLVHLDERMYVYYELSEGFVVFRFETNEVTSIEVHNAILGLLKKAETPS